MVDERYRTLIEYVTNSFVEHLGSRLRSIYIKGSVARGDALWGISDLDLVLAFEAPTPEDTALKRTLEEEVLTLPGGEVLVIQRIGADRMAGMSEGLLAYWLHSSRYDVATVYGDEPHTFLPEPPTGKRLAQLIAPIMQEDGAQELGKATLTRTESRHLAKRILHGLTLLPIAREECRHVAPMAITQWQYPATIDRHLAMVITTYTEAPAIDEPAPLFAAWHAIWPYVLSEIA